MSDKGGVNLTSNIQMHTKKGIYTYTSCVVPQCNSFATVIIQLWSQHYQKAAGLKKHIGKLKIDCVNTIKKSVVCPYFLFLCSFQKQFILYPLFVFISNHPSHSGLGPFQKYITKAVVGVSSGPYSGKIDWQ